MNGTIQVVIPFRDRGTDPRRAANLDVVQAWWYAHGFEPRIVDDGLEGDAPFNRHRAYNRAVAEHPGDVYVFTEADMLIHPEQILIAARLAQRRPGLVVPFTQYRYWSDGKTEVFRDLYQDQTTEFIADWWGQPVLSERSLFLSEAESTMDNGTSIGAVNVMSRETLDITGGFTEATHGNWYDDRIIEEGFALLTSRRTRFVPGPAVHLYHLPGWKGDHLTERDKIATEHNRQMLAVVRNAIQQGNRKIVHDLMQYRSKEQ